MRIILITGFWLFATITVRAVSPLDRPLGPQVGQSLPAIRDAAHSILADEESRRDFDRALAELISNTTSTVKGALSSREIEALHADLLRGSGIRQIILAGSVVALSRLRAAEVEVSRMPDGRREREYQLILAERSLVIDTMRQYLSTSPDGAHRGSLDGRR
jgi:hypothetical protein